MDRTSVKVLKHINKKSGPVLAEQIAEKFGDKGTQSLSMLCREGYLSRSLEKSVMPEILTNAYYIEPLGRDFL